ncbi:PREDICTED: coiled-coil domain-containing protein 85C-A-like [Rhagoletis zephyria]|uniref:coiled-coil domain-containing protein 85C-A-like n=1 Tax=Rhagoletis zephyria TaxID=28612 RepID=UPI0008113F9F|nr:PREDICTED: coiled-coil domain-containing protein 85C-A-like [Rhagoletis zephyria]
MRDRTAMDKRDEEILELKQKLIDLMKENNEMKELVLFLDEERNFARQFMRDVNSKQSLNWNSLKQKLAYLEQKQFELIRENYSLKQLCVLLDENAATPQVFQSSADKSTNQVTGKATSVCQYILHLENELRMRGTNLNRPKHISEALQLHSLTNGANGGGSSSVSSAEEKCILEMLSETAIKTILNR